MKISLLRRYGIPLLCWGLLASAAGAGAQETARASWAVTSDGTRLAVHEDDGRRLRVADLAHGIAQSQLAFHRQAQGDLARRFRLITYDLRGHGESDKPAAPEAYTAPRRMSDDLRAVLQATHASKPVLVGWSLGGIVVAQYLSDYGDGEIAGVNFVGARIAQPPGQPARMPGGAHLRDMQSPDLERNIRATAAFVRACVATRLADADFELMLGYNMASPVYARTATLKWSGGTDFAQALPRLKVPVLITHGRRDQVISPEVAAQAGRLIPGARVSWYDEAGHSPFFEDAARFDRELAAFVDAAVKP